MRRTSSQPLPWKRLGSVSTQDDTLNEASLPRQRSTILVEIDTQSVVSLMLGGVAFGNPMDTDLGPLANRDTVFKLYPNRKRAFAKAITRKSRWRLHFAESVRGLSVGAPVEFRGIEIGKVIDIKLQINLDAVSIRIPVLIEIEADRLEPPAQTTPLRPQDTYDASRRQFWDQLVAKGLRAQLKIGSLLTGAQFIDLDFYPSNPPNPSSGKPTIPSYRRFQPRLRSSEMCW